MDALIYERAALWWQEDDDDIQQQQLNAFLQAADAVGDDVIRFVMSRSLSVFDRYNVSSPSALIVFRQVGRMLGFFYRATPHMLARGWC